MTAPQDSSPGKAIEHYVSPEPFEPHTVVPLTPEQERYYLASQWQLMWWKLKRHKLAVISGLEHFYFTLVHIRQR